MSTAFLRGVVLYEQNRFDLADREFRQALADDPDSASAHSYLSLCLSHVDKYDEALREAEEAVRIEPGQPFSHYTRGRALLGLGRHREAEVSARQVIS